MIRALLLIGALLGGALSLSTPARAVEPGELLADPALEARARDVSKLLRCLVCQNESIDDSHADLARDLRRLVRERLTAGDSNDQALDYIHQRYGDFVLLKPPVREGTWLLWFGPAVLALGALTAAALRVRSARRQAAEEPPAPLSPEEAHALERLMHSPHKEPRA